MAKKYQFTVNTLSNCFFCLKETNNLSGNCKNGGNEKVISNINIINGKPFSLKLILRYLNIDLSQIRSISAKQLSLLNKTDVRVKSCIDCQVEMENFSKLFAEYELIKMRLDSMIKYFHMNIVKSQNNTNLTKNYYEQIQTDVAAARHSRIVDELRTMLKQKCGDIIAKLLPTINLKQFSAANVDKSIQPSSLNINYLGPDGGVVLLCVTCNISFPDYYNLQLHQQSSHSDDHLCPRCDSFFDNKEKLNEHISQCLGRVTTMSLKPTNVIAKGARGPLLRKLKWRRYVCDECPKRFYISSELLNHKRVHTGERPFKCNYCNFRFKQIAHRNRHVWRKHECPTKYKGNEKNMLHVHKVPPLADTVVGILETTKIVIKQESTDSPSKTNSDHVSISLSKSAKICEFCQKVFRTNQELVVHRRVHTNERPFCCSICSYKSKQQNHLVKHFRIIHKINQTSTKRKVKTSKALLGTRTHPNQSKPENHNFETVSPSPHPDKWTLYHPSIVNCPSCNATFMSRRDLQVHQEDCHEDDHLCKICDSFFDEPDILKDHEPLCKMKPSSKGNLDWFIESDKLLQSYFEFTIDELFKCKKCPFITNIKSELVSHIDHLHIFQYPFKCDICHYRFKKNGNMMRHKNVHNKKKTLKVTNKSLYKFKCKFCGKLFKQNGELLAHERVHTGERPFECPYCDLTFKQLAHQIRHVKRQHKDKPKMMVRKYQQKFKRTRTTSKSEVKRREDSTPIPIASIKCEPDCEPSSIKHEPL